MNGKTHRKSIEKEISDSFGFLLEDLDVLEDLFVDLDFVDVPDRIFTEEIERDLVRRREGDVFETKGTTSDRVGFVFSLFVSGTKSESIDEVDGSRTLASRHFF